MIFKRIKDLREDHDLLQKDIANLLGISQQYYSEYEKGNRTKDLLDFFALNVGYEGETPEILIGDLPPGQEAFAAPDHNTIVIDRKVLASADSDKVLSLLAHELGHFNSYDANTESTAKRVEDAIQGTKNKGKYTEKLEKELESYQTSAKYIKEHKILMLKTVITTVIQMIAYYSVPYWIYLAFGLTEYNIFEILTLQAVLYATVSGIPSPGAVGVSEGGFLGIFRNVFPETIISSAMLLTRGANFYLFIIISAIIVMISTFREKKIEKKQMQETEVLTEKSEK